MCFFRDCAFGSEHVSSNPLVTGFSWHQVCRPWPAPAQLPCRCKVSFRQRCVIQKLGLFLLGLSCKDAAYRGTTDAESSGELRLADTGAVQFVDLVGMQGGRDGASQTSAVLPGMCEAGTDSFA